MNKLNTVTCNFFVLTHTEKSPIYSVVYNKSRWSFLVYEVILSVQFAWLGNITRFTKCNTCDCLLYPYKLHSKLLQYTINVESDTKMVESQTSEMANWVPMTVVREVKDGKIHEVCL